MDLFSRKIISWNLSGKPDVNLVMAAFQKAYNLREQPDGLMFRFTQIVVLNTPQVHSENYWMISMLFNPFQRKAIPSITPVAKASSNISKKKKPIEEPITLYKNCNYPSLNT